MRNYLFGLVTAGVIACQFENLESPAFYVTVWSTFAVLAVALMIRKAR
jgi:hypothetical protein